MEPAELKKLLFKRKSGQLTRHETFKLSLPKHGEDHKGRLMARIENRGRNFKGQMEISKEVVKMLGGRLEAYFVGQVNEAGIVLMKEDQECQPW